MWVFLWLCDIKYLYHLIKLAERKHPIVKIRLNERRFIRSLKRLVFYRKSRAADSVPNTMSIQESRLIRRSARVSDEALRRDKRCVITKTPEPLETCQIFPYSIHELDVGDFWALSSLFLAGGDNQTMG
ncbi:hypothetical protein BO70DRAFT_362859 [Aspergillus heteromorphus CBS 117.55]|uniref:Uncharacterized protein n=1 Tax=Aspergillus heteromorphus CBS 117.55 TaxID=1448321 RepID=A0A317VZQ5_9EURO|nr:uncharacterized protein BO70DRAFT_362859 [Aspergillus heteromorphus CBS 117.55]PWY79723.1 hypothetical protein BO70DRAFT_362859 [Aspergillus heteromorphus CBS 117.55]